MEIHGSCDPEVAASRFLSLSGMKPMAIIWSPATVSKIGSGRYKSWARSGSPCSSLLIRAMRLTYLQSQQCSHRPDEGLQSGLKFPTLETTSPWVPSQWQPPRAIGGLGWQTPLISEEEAQVTAHLMSMPSTWRALDAMINTDPGHRHGSLVVHRWHRSSYVDTTNC